jgi:hypothetical protein
MDRLPMHWRTPNSRDLTGKLVTGPEENASRR